VVIQASSDDDRHRLDAQLQVLDALQRPRIVATPLPQLAQALERTQRFEWIAGRQPWRELSPDGLQQHAEWLNHLAAPTAELRLLFTTPLLGPAAALLAMTQAQTTGLPSTGLRIDASLQRQLEAVTLQEPGWLMVGDGHRQLAALLQERGWQVEVLRWQEDLDLRLNAALLQRWFGAEARYRGQLERHLDAATIEQLRQTLSDLEGRRLPQRLDHTLLQARRSKAPDQPGLVA
jgi:putative ATPase